VRFELLPRCCPPQRSRVCADSQGKGKRGLCRVKGARPPHAHSPTGASHHVTTSSEIKDRRGLRPDGAARGVTRHDCWQIAGKPRCSFSARSTLLGRTGGKRP
jgi:hypothetical protein